MKIFDFDLNDRKVRKRTVGELLDDIERRSVSEASIEEAVRVLDDPSPAMIEGYAQWLELIAELKTVLSPIEILQVAANAQRGSYQPGMSAAPAKEIVELLLREPGAHAWAEAVAAAKLDGRLAELQPIARAALEGKTVSKKNPKQARPDVIAYARRMSEENLGEADLFAFVPTTRDRAVKVAGVAELKDRAKWVDAGAKRRRAIASAVAQAAGMTLAEIEDFDVPVAQLVHASGIVFSLIPGGTFSMGLPPAEEALMREAGGDVDADDMRPVRRVKVAPFLISRAPLGNEAITALEDGTRTRKKREEPAVTPYVRIVELLQDSPFRLPTEAEREYASRGEREELAPRGIRERDLKKLEKPAGAFGLMHLGLWPELCSDPYARGYGKPPTKATKPLAVRGGAAYVSPWQGTEWLLLCHATRSHTDGWDGDVAVRLALGIR